MKLLGRRQLAIRPYAPAVQASGFVPFEARHASLVAGWVRSDKDLFMLSPRTPGPLTAAKVIGWKQAGGDQLMYHDPGDGEPCGYVELNPMPEGGRHWWIGHCIVAPHQRGNGTGLRMVRLVLDRAFEYRDARRVSLVVFPGNFGAVRCYCVAGLGERREIYREFATRPGQHRMLYMSIDHHEHRFLRGRLA